MKRFWPLLEEILNFQRYQGTYNHIVCIGILINPLIKKDHPLFCQARLKSPNCPIPYFSLFPSIYWFFVNPLLQTFLVKISQVIAAEKWLDTMNHVFESNDLSKKFWCLVYGTEDSIFRTFCCKASWRWTYIHNELVYYISSILTDLFFLQM